VTLNSISSGLPSLGTPVVATNTITDNDVVQFTIAKTQSAGPNPITAAGQTMTYTVTVANTGTVPLTAPSFSDVFQLGSTARSFTTGPTLSGDAAPTGTLDIGETWIYTATYDVTQSDMNGTGTFNNQATFDTAETTPSSSSIVTTNVTRSPALSLNKTWSFASPGHDANGNGVADVGDIITYTYAVSNSGNITIANVNVSDIHNGYGALGPITPTNVSTLAPGSSTSFTATYVAVQGDLDNQ
jgi:uncharacterized repeat protein (TIGR01451 family)